ncbi:MAG: hypothetical protein IMZ51_03895 [Chloroflexi bacterium]|nr:hypothetical protein [Chloroflexota bacterium]
MMENLSKKIKFDGETAVLLIEDVKKFIKQICNKMNCQWRCDVIKEHAGPKLI